MHVMTAEPLWTDAMSWYPYSEGVEAAYTFISTYGDTVKLAVKRGDHILVPRNLAPIGPEDKRSKNFLGAIDCKAGPREEDQARVIKESFNLLQGGRNHCVEAPTGFGKTYVGSAVASMLGQTTLIVVNKEDLKKQWYNTLINLIGVPTDQIGIAQGDKLDYKGKRFVISMAQSLMKPDKYDTAFWRYFGLTVFDEVDVMAAKCISYIPTVSTSYYRLGLSATPKRADGKTPVLDAHIGKVMVRGVSIPMKSKVLVRNTGWQIPHGIKVDPGQMMGVYSVMAKSHSRNAMIVDFIHRAYVAGRRTTLVLADTLEHLNTLQSLTIMSGIPAIDCGMYTGELSKQPGVLKANALKRVVFGTYGMCQRGTDYPHWDTEVYATPRATIKQGFGRILRKLEGKKQPLCLDLVDDHKLLKGFFNKRRVTYFELKADIVYL